MERLAQYFRLRPENKAQLRARYGLALFDRLVARAQTESITVLPESGLGAGLHYLLAPREPLRRCLEETRAELSNNAVERAIRPLKLGAKNWLQVGHPAAGPRLANLFTIVENCRQAGVDPEAYLIDLIERLPGHPAARVAELLPRAWSRSEPAATTPGPGSGPDQAR